ncbi:MULTISPECIES: amino acid adenylation domain-containing protein [Brenneria]|uniref:Non-ribosomal peptide synthetase n=1 Tax=Brenneria nigrifluens DSM 30175 = ATCC 13028 TaxID=1121120 RepID=A0A2U1UP72_9GAMM|nr:MULTISPECIES: non-ribosomal peptide synthetase [Brenneria]EHD23287.1 amino acid adenylation domain protein [Brenneria sp. EniD312]PWC23475.1 non-ribosomal peptide synthetase [Brenneria nigrifluens DSM 30175 = ATCC 13028]QCR06220.1 non-ribosomal peptide synthetase [Brenneria nigrifluens DSM 30175 = ATCC 13028]
MSETGLAPEIQADFQELPLVAAQPGIWFAEQIAAQRNAFTVAHVIELCGPVDRDCLDAAIRQGLSEADTVHARFCLSESDTPVQRLPRRVQAPQVNAPEWLDVSEEGENAAHALIQDDLASDLPADGARPLYRQVLMRVSAQPERWFWYQRFHHLMLDGFSFDALTRRIVDIYNARRNGQSPGDTPFTPFSQVVDEYQAWQSSASCRRAAAFWQEHARDLPAPVSLAGEVCSPVPQGARTLHHRLNLAVSPFEALNADEDLARAEPAEIVMAALYIYLYRMSGSPRLSVGFPFMRRMGSAALCAIGPVVNVLPLQLTLRPDITLAEVTQALLDEIKTVRRHQRYEAEQLRRDLGRVGSSEGLYGPVINFKVYNAALKLDGTTAITHTLAMGPVDDLEFELGIGDGKLHLTLAANPGRYNAQTLQWHAERIAYLLKQLLQQPRQPISRFSVVSDDEQRRMALWACGPRLAMPTGAVSVVDRLLHQVEKQPDAVAVRCGEASLSYRELADRVMQLARVLIARGLGAEDVVAVGIPRSTDSLVAIFGVLASGAAYMPLDLDYPRERLALMCEDARPALLLTHRTVAERMPALPQTLCLDDADAQAACREMSSAPVRDAERREALRGEHLAYMIYTSGSTGRPKGVMSTHGGLLNLLASHAAFLFGPAMETFSRRYGRRLRAGHTASFSFDSSWEPLFCLILGCELYIFNEELRRDAWALVQHLHQTPVDLMDVTPSFFSQMIDSGLLEPGTPKPGFIMIGGEAATPRLWQLMRQQSDMAIHNYYGPSEYTIDTLGAAIQTAAQPVIGRPVANTDVWLLDHRLQPVPPGVAGELYISGPGIARGYLRRPDLTATRFVANPFRPGEVMYRTGDLMRWRSDGQLAFIGRVDHQIKIRGFRVELGEVENALVALPQVSTAVAIAESVGATHRLIGYCSVPDAALREQPDISSRLLEQLAAQLPDYMVPSVLVVLEELPLTVNGKIDRQALPAPQPAQPHQSRDAQGEQEILICQSIAALLGLERIGADDDFFASGGDSISAMGLGTLLRRAGWQLRPRDIFAQRTPARMASVMEPLSTPSRAPRSPQRGPIDGLPILRWFAEQGINRRFAHGVFLRVPAALQQAHLEQALAALSATHPALAAFTRDDRLIVGEQPPVTLPSRCEVRQIADDLAASAERAFDAALEKLQPAAGLMMHAVLLQRENQSCGLVMVIHHLVVDGVSWRILLPALQQAAEAAMAGQAIALTPETASLHDWSSWLLEDLPRRQAELPLWQSMLQAPLPLLGQRPLDAAQDRQQAQREKRLLLDAAPTTALLTSLPQRYRAGTEEMLLAALGLACQRYYGVSQLRVMLESHGRADVANSVDLSRTLGWLTAEYPVQMAWPATTADTPWQVVRAVKRVVRAIPDRGIGYGMLRYLDDTAANPLPTLARQHAPEILFNYLGRFSGGNALWTPQRTERRFRDAFAVAQDGHTPLGYALEINIFVDEQSPAPRLAVHWGWADGIFTEQDIDALHQHLAQAVERLADFARRHPAQAADTLVAAEVMQEGVTDDQLLRLRQVHGPLAAVLPVLPLQQGLLFHAQLADSAGSYNSVTRLSLHGALDSAQLRQALETVVRRHPQLTARFDTELTQTPLQLLPLLRDDETYWPFDEQALPALSPQAETDALLALEKSELARDLFRQPHAMLHALLVRHGESSRHTLFLNAHHLVVDGWSTPILLHDLFTILQQGETALAAHRVSYPQVVRQLADRNADTARQRWREALHGVRPTLLFGEQPHDGAVHELELLPEPRLEQELTQLCRRYGLTLNTLMQGVWGVLLSSYSGFNDVIFGSPVSGRFGQIDGLEQHVGLFSNTLPVRVTFSPDRPLLSQLAELQSRQIQLIEYDNLGLGEIQQLAGAGTLFDTLLVVENYPDHAIADDEKTALRCSHINNRGYTHYPLTLLVLPGERLRLLMEYRDSVAHPQRLAQRLMLLLEQLVRQTDLPLGAWRLQTPEEQALIAAVNGTAHHVPPGTLHQAVDEQARRTPDRVALLDREHRLTYRQMRTQVQLLAERLIAAGVRPGDIVAVALPRSVRLSLSLQAILEAGAAWLPLDTGYPDERLALMVDDASPRLIITESGLQTRFAPLAPLLLLDRLADERRQPTAPDIRVDPRQAAYVIYTSGSTGRPKGVVVSHQAIVNRLWWMQDSYRLTDDDVVLQKTPCSFDVSVWEFFWPLMTGASLVMAPPEAHRDPDALRQLIDDYAVTTLHFVPSMLAAWVSALASRQQIGCTSLRRVFCSGEALSRELALSYQSSIAAPLHNLYGPTEAAVDVTYQPASGAALTRIHAPGVPIGLPVWNTQLRILDGYLRPVPVGVAGDLYLCGIQLAQGYLRRPDLTAARFVADPFAEGERMYRTGDIARWLDDGAVEYLGRSDDQLKIRGQRIELGEIEQTLLAQPGVMQAVVCARNLGQASLAGADARQLVAWIIPQAGVALDTDDLHQALTQQLPAHMLPVCYVPMSEFPLSANGKLDRKALPDPQMRRESGRVPASDTERLLASLFAEILERDTVFADEDFFALGGHSLLAMRLTAEIRRRLHQPLSVGQIMAARSVEKIAALLDGQQSADSAESRGIGETMPLRAGTGPVLFCLHPASGFAWQYAGLLRYLDGKYPIVGLQSPRPQGVIARCNDVAAMCEHHLDAIRRIQPEGPYFLLGYSLGGTLAQGIAARLQQAGQSVAFLGLLDTYPPEGQDWTGPSEEEARQEVAHEQAAFMAATEEESDPQLRAEKAAMFNSIVANYKDAVRLLSDAATPHYAGVATLFIATHTLPAGMDVSAAWAPYVGALTTYPQPCEHADILSPASLTHLGPQLSRLLSDYPQLAR